MNLKRKPWGLKRKKVSKNSQKWSNKEIFPLIETWKDKFEDQQKIEPWKTGSQFVVYTT
jgi:hypothetical protein